MNLVVIFEWFLTFWAPGDEKFSFFPNIPKQAFLYTCINKFPWEFEKKKLTFLFFYSTPKHEDHSQCFSCKHEFSRLASCLIKLQLQLCNDAGSKMGFRINVLQTEQFHGHRYCCGLCSQLDGYVVRQVISVIIQC